MEKANMESPLLGKKEKEELPELPDLSEQIKQAGLWAEYQRYRQGYLNWRKGKPQGARGEVTESGLVAERERLEFLEPSDAEWFWRKTVSYWIVILTLEGSITFLFTSFSSCYPSYWGELLEAVTLQSNCVGSTMFFISTYLLCFEVINLKCEEKRYNPFCVRRNIAHCREIGLHPWPFLAGLTYFTGASLFQVQLTLSLLLPWVAAIPAVHFWVVDMGTLIGGWLFFLGSLCEVKEWISGRGGTILVAVIHNVMGSALFALGGTAYMFKARPNFDPTWVGGMAYGIGCYGFIVGSVVSLMLWRDGNFGLTYSAQLAKLKMKGPADRFSFFGILFVAGCCSLGAIGVMVFWSEAEVNKHNAHDEADYLTRTFYPLLIFVLVHLAIALRSAVVRVPKEQPWRGLHKACHMMLFLASMVLVAQFLDCLYQVKSSRVWSSSESSNPFG